VTAYLYVFLAAAGTTFVATPIVRRIVLRLGWIDEPNDRKVHATATPTMGGIAMYAGFLAALLLSRFLPFFGQMNRASPELLAALVTCTLMVTLGAIDDRRGTSGLAKFTAQVFIAGVLVLMGATFAYFWFPGRTGILVLSSDLAVLLTVAWVVLVANAVNLVDGLDGLAAGMVAIAAGAFFLYIVGSPSLFGDASAAALLSATTAGICVGFLPWNFHPAKIFMGDSGAMLLGMLLAIATISGIGRNAIRPSGGDFASAFGTVLVPLLVLIVPLLDVLLAIVRRTRRGVGWDHADKQHLHHRLMDIGHSHRQAVLLMYLWSALVSISFLAVGFINGRAVVGLILLATVTLFAVTALPRLVERRVNGNGVVALPDTQPPSIRADGTERPGSPGGAGSPEGNGAGPARSPQTDPLSGPYN
jgi:UDP-GlcNAc:undecaprenyl-phosphate GlcNAc-1-phosphate transferase